MLGGMGLAGQGFSQAPRFVSHAGLLQRAAIVAGFSWLTAVSDPAAATSIVHSLTSALQRAAGHRQIGVLQDPPATPGS